jgi:hypothetical protein
MIHAARPQGDAETLARIADAGFVLAEVAEHFGLIDGILPRDAVVDRLARGDVLSEAKL